MGVRWRGYVKSGVRPPLPAAPPSAFVPSRTGIFLLSCRVRVAVRVVQCMHVTCLYYFFPFFFCTVLLL